MTFKIDRAIFYLYCFLMFSVPLAFFTKTSELFEFNKMILTYLIAVLILFFWVVKMITAKKIIFKRTLLDIPILVFLLSQVFSTFLSLDARTSLLGYYSRFHGGLASSVTYILLYWGFVANMDRQKTLTAIKSLFLGAAVVSVWAIFEHFGKSFSCLLIPQYRSFDVSCWEQDVQNRVYATLGQPNWLAAWIVTLIPLTWAFSLISKIKDQKLNIQIKNPKFYFWVILSIIFFSTLLFTKSRSGLLGFAASSLIFWVLYLVRSLKDKKIFNFLYVFLIFNILFLILISISGTPWTPSINKIAKRQIEAPVEQNIKAPALEVGGTASDKIRKIVWRGAFDVWKTYPVFGSGVEAFAFSYYLYRPVGHNMVSEWDFLYNKAHNEYLNFAATTGTIGLSAYLLLIIFIFIQFKIAYQNVKLKSADKLSNLNLNFELYTFNFALASGFVSILVTNFFGFSVVPVALLFFLYPAMATALKESDGENQELRIGDLGKIQKVSIVFTLLLTFYFLLLISKYWYADYSYSQAKLQDEIGNLAKAREHINTAIKLSPNEAIYYEELSENSKNSAISLNQGGDNNLSTKFAESAAAEINKAISLSTANVNIKRTAANVFIELSTINQNYLLAATDILEKAVKQAPTDAKLYYNLALAYLRIGETERAVQILNKTIDMKPDYSKAHYALGLIYIDMGEKQKAKAEFKYILDKIDPNDVLVKRELDELGP